MDKSGYQICQATKKSILESISDGVFTVDLNFNITSFNRAAEEITGYPRSTAVGKPCREVFRSNMCDKNCVLCRTIESNDPIIDESSYIIHASGRKIPVSISTGLIRDSTDGVMGGALTFRDLSLNASTETILDSISDGVFTVDLNFHITSFNHAAQEISGVSREEAIGKTCMEVFHAGQCDKKCALQETMEKGSSVLNKCTHITNSKGQNIPVSVSASPLLDRGNNIIGVVQTFRDLSLIEKLRHELEGRVQIGNMVTRSSAMRKIVDILPQIAVSDSTVLIKGNTGTGKELVAQAIHSLSNRSAKPFIALNCGALPETLLESELFGYKAGAFTGANKDKIGRFGMAEGGTLFLDEIGEISPALQVRLLRVLQEKTYEPLGSTESMHSDVRVIAATNRSLSGLIAEGKFREDFYYRIKVIQIDLPTLKERKEDIPLLVNHFISRFNTIQKKTIHGVSQEVMALLMGHDFPGNIRELENIIEHAFVLCPDEFITPACLPADFMRGAPPTNNESAGMEKVVQAVESQTILEALKRNNYNRIAAARDLGIHKSTLFRKIKHLGIALPELDGRFRETANKESFV
ncbi:MAG: sigma 54-interacting transcriptional regulator [Proteobacteria bacterium]|nr:sigma 54-interacting transcriptional regulator [Pseudomonadota bacterium]MBU1716011.1 sigma 54-interacting transcriptional regulator [Pseudomonadota bacterium]